MPSTCDDMLGRALGGAWQVQPVVQHDAGAPRAGTYIHFVVSPL